MFFREVNDKWGWFEDGNKDKDVKYIGEFKDGTSEDRQPNGQGTITYPNGRKYVGGWKDGKKDGQGTKTWSNGDKYVGEYKNGEYHGLETFTWSDGHKYEDSFHPVFVMSCHVSLSHLAQAHEFSKIEYLAPPP